MDVRGKNGRKRDSQGVWDEEVHTAAFKRTYYIACGTLLNDMWQPRWEEGLWDNGYTCMYG